MIILFYAIFKPKSIMLYTLESSIGVNYRFLKAPFISNKICHERWKDDLRGSFEIMLAWPSISDNFPFKYWSGCYYFFNLLDRKRFKINRMFEEDAAFYQKWWYIKFQSHLSVIKYRIVVSWYVLISIGERVKYLKPMGNVLFLSQSFHL